uniref:Uncharacterized protein n=1 Tax=Glossina austeni TaxID=7395 RepID=A0A1A9VVC3_GLOAU
MNGSASDPRGGPSHDVQEMIASARNVATNLELKTIATDSLNPEDFDIEAEVQNMTKRDAWLTVLIQMYLMLVLMPVR